MSIQSHVAARSTLQDKRPQIFVGERLGQISLRSMLIVVFAIALNLAVFRQVSIDAGIASSLISFAVAMHIVASHVGHRTLMIGSAIGADCRTTLQFAQTSHFESEEVEIDASANWDRKPPYRSSCRAANYGFYISSVIGMAVGPWISFEVMARVHAESAHPLSIFAVCAAGALLGVAVALIARAAMRLMGTAIHSLRMMPQR